MEAIIVKIINRIFLTVLLLIPQLLLAQPNGKELYLLYCEACHQSEGKGGIGLPLSTEKLHYVSDSFLAKTIRHGRTGRIMPGYPGLKDAEVDAIVEYMRNWSDQPAMTFSDRTITGDLANGKKLYLKKCKKCHAEDGSGEGLGTGVTASRERSFMVMPSALNNPDYHAAVTDEGIREIIVADREDSEMPSMAGRLEPREIDDIVAYVRSLKKPPAEPLEDPDELSILMESENDFQSTVDAVRLALTGSNFRTFPERYLEEGLADEFSVNKRQVRLRFCNFSTLFDMLRIEPRLGVVLPCNITVMEQADGRVVMVAPNVVNIAAWFNNDELSEMASEMTESIISVLEEATL